MAMKNSRRIGAILGTALAAVTTASVATAAPAAAAAAPIRPDGPRPVATAWPAVANYQSKWLSIWWKTDLAICDAKVRVRSMPGMQIAYPSNRTFTSFAHGPALQRRESDYTSFLVTPHLRKPTVEWLEATITYNNCGWHARTQTRSTGFLLRVRG
jgi:hypothetical protein